MPDANWLFLDAPHNQNLKYAIYFTKISKYGQNEYSRALNASYTFQPLMGFCFNPIMKSCHSNKKT